MRYEIVRSREGFEVLKPVITPHSDFSQTIVIGDEESWTVPYLQVGLNLFNPCSPASIWVYSGCFYAVPDGLRDNGFAMAGIAGDCREFEATPAQIVNLWKIRYGDHFTSTEQAFLRSFVEAISATYENRDVDEPDAAVLYEAASKLSTEFLSYVMRDKFVQIVLGISSLDSLKMSPTYTQLVAAVKEGVPDGGGNFRITESDAEHFGVACGAQLSRADRSVAISQGKMLKMFLVCFAISDDKLAVAQAFQSAFDEALRLLA